MLIHDHHPGYIDWETFEANRMRIDSNTRPRAHRAANPDDPPAGEQGPTGEPAGGMVREGTALLQGLAVCGHCGRRLRTHYRGRNSSPGYHCPGKSVVEGRGQYCLSVGGCQIDAAVAEAFLTALQPAGLHAALLAAERLEAGHDAALAQWRLEVERRRYEASLAERRYQAVDPENRLVARGEVVVVEDRLGVAGPTETSPCITWSAASGSDRQACAIPNAPRSWPSAGTCPLSGRPRPQPTATARNCCGPCWRT